jgi:uncharacterized protein YaiE (UPF0345 family)
VVNTKDTILLSGKHSVQSNVNYGFGATFDCFGSESDVNDIVGMIGSSQTLTIGTTAYTKCYITGNIEVQESDNPDWVYYSVGFVQETS